MKNWSELSNKEKAEITFRDIKKRQEKRKRNIADINNYVVENVIKANSYRREVKKRETRSF